MFHHEGWNVGTPFFYPSTILPQDIEGFVTVDDNPCWLQHLESREIDLLALIFRKELELGTGVDSIVCPHHIPLDIQWFGITTAP
jgi:hypothetical protein